MTSTSARRRASLAIEIQAAFKTQRRFDGSDRSSPGEKIRESHAVQRHHLMVREAPFVRKHLPQLIFDFASGAEVVPERIEPEIIPVTSGTAEADLFRLVTALWSVPVSRGFGRRMRFLVRDRSNGRLVGIFALGDPVFNLGVRDEWIGWTLEERRRRLVSVMDGYVVGAVPPYNMLLAGKLVTSLIAAREVADLFQRRYQHTQGRISGERKRAELAAVTITSALGRSSMYNRVRLPGLLRLERLGDTKGYGHFHVSDPIFAQMRELLQIDGHRYANGYAFGEGPSWRMRVIREALRRVGLDDELIRHGIAREVYGMGLAGDWREYLRGQVDACQATRPKAQDIADAALKRWLVPRSRRMSDYVAWRRQDTEALFMRAMDLAGQTPPAQLAMQFS